MTHEAQYTIEKKSLLGVEYLDVTPVKGSKGFGDGKSEKNGGLKTGKKEKILQMRREAEAEGDRCRSKKQMKAD